MSQKENLWQGNVILNALHVDYATIIQNPYLIWEAQKPKEHRKHPQDMGWARTFWIVKNTNRTETNQVSIDGTT